MPASIFGDNDELIKVRRELQACKHALQLSKASAEFYKDALDEAQKEIEQLKLTIRKEKDKSAMLKAQRKVKRCKKALKKAKQDKDNIVKAVGKPIEDPSNIEANEISQFATTWLDHAKYAEIETIRIDIHELSKAYHIPISEQNGPYQVHKNAIIRASTTDPKPVLRSFGGIRAFSKQYNNLPRLIDDAAIVMIANMTSEMKMDLQNSIARERSILHQKYKTANMADLIDAIIDNPTYLQEICFPKQIDAPHQIATFMVAVRVRNLIAHVNTFDELINNHAHLKKLYLASQA